MSTIKKCCKQLAEEVPQQEGRLLCVGVWKGGREFRFVCISIKMNEKGTGFSRAGAPMIGNHVVGEADGSRHGRC